MKFTTITISSFTLLLTCLAGAQKTAQIDVPAIPAGLGFHERTALTQTAYQISKGQFDQAQALIQPLLPAAKTQIYVDWASAPDSMRESYRKAIAETAEAWNRGLGGDVAFRFINQKSEADVIIGFDDDPSKIWTTGLDTPCMEAGVIASDNPKPFQGRTIQVKIRLNVLKTGPFHSPSSVAHLFGQTLGAYLGLTSTTSKTDIMGPDDHFADPQQKPSIEEIAKARTYQRTRIALMDLITRRIAAHLARPVISVDKTDVDAGDVYRGDQIKYSFKVKNSGDAPLQIEAKPTCGCTVADYDKVIKPGAEGEIKATINTSAFHGPILKAMALFSNDPDTPQVNLKMKAMVKTIVTVFPSENSIVRLQDKGPTVQEYKITVARKEPVEFKNLVCSAPYARVSVDPVSNETADGREYKLTLTVDGTAPAGRSSLAIAAQLNVPLQPQLKITAYCDKGILTMPDSLYFGLLPPTPEEPYDQIVRLNRSVGEFHILKVESDDPNLRVRLETLKNGESYRVIATYKGGWAPGEVKRTVTVYTDDPTQPKIIIPAIASITAPTSSR